MKRILLLTTLLSVIMALTMLSGQSQASLNHVDTYFSNLITPLDQKLRAQRELLKKIQEIKREIRVVEKLLVMVQKLKVTPTRTRLVKLLQDLLAKLRAELAALLKKNASLYGPVIKRRGYLHGLRGAVRKARKDLRSLRKRVRLPCRFRQRCFAGEAQIQMQDGSFKAASQIKLGDVLSTGKVTGVMQFDAKQAQIFNYNGVLVTGEHSVYEDGQWKKVRDAKQSQAVQNNLDLVYDFNTETHKIIAGQKLTTFADFQEVESPEIEALELKLLNEQSL